MRRYLVVANQTLGGQHLLDKVRECLDAGPCSFHIVAPATRPREHLTWVEGEAMAIAGDRLERALKEFHNLGAEADGEVGDADPVQAIGDALREQGHHFDEIILSTLPLGPSRWLKRDVPHRVEGLFRLPVTCIIGMPEKAGP
jgi:hypothetical protein